MQKSTMCKQSTPITGNVSAERKAPKRFHKLRTAQIKRRMDTCMCYTVKGVCDHTDPADGAHLRTVGRILPCAAPGRYAADPRSKATSGRSTKPYVRSARRPEVCKTSSTAEAFEGLGFRAGHSHLAYNIISFRQLSCKRSPLTFGSWCHQQGPLSAPSALMITFTGCTFCFQPPFILLTYMSNRERFCLASGLNVH